jgi:hypothetical protein
MGSGTTGNDLGTALAARRHKPTVNNPNSEATPRHPNDDHFTQRRTRRRRGFSETFRASVDSTPGFFMCETGSRDRPGCGVIHQAEQHGRRAQRIEVVPA